MRIIVQWLASERRKESVIYLRNLYLIWRKYRPVVGVDV
jgi:lipid-A-disaccharide synthase-like uncharacterized protein